MNSLVDTCVWSCALRRGSHDPDGVVAELSELVREGRVVLIGPVRQEVLSGIRERRQFKRLRESLRAFPDCRLEPQDFESAADFYNYCRGRGVQGSNTDFLICAVADRLCATIFTLDKDFGLVARHLPVKLHTVRHKP